MGIAGNTTASVIESLQKGKLTINGRLVWLEALASSIAAILAIAFIFAPFPRWRRHWFPKIIILIAEAVADRWITYAVGQMQSAPYQNELYWVWAMLLYIAYGTFWTASAYSLHIQFQRRTEHEMAQLNDIFLIALLIFLKPGESPFCLALRVLWGLTVLKAFQRIFSFGVAVQTFGLKNTKLIADYMRYENKPSGKDLVDPTTMKGYKYLIMGEEKVRPEANPPDYVVEVNIDNNKVVTVEKVWGCSGGLLNSSGDPDGRLKDMCLSFAFFKLLKRRLFRYPSAESELSKAHKLVFEGLLSTDDERVFRVINMELGFFHDLVYTKYPISFSSWFPFFNILLFVVILVTGWVSLQTVTDYKVPENNINRVLNKKNIDLIVTGAIMLLVLLMELWEFINYLASDWAKIILISRYVRSRWMQNCRCIEIVIKFLCRLKGIKPLENKIRQYSFLESFKYTPRSLLYTLTRGFAGKKRRNGVKIRKAIKLPTEVKEKIGSCLKQSRGSLSNGKSSLIRNEVSEQLSWACQLKTQALTIMVWHIATSFCEAHMQESQVGCCGLCEAFMPSQKKGAITSNQLVATSLSRYCAYLVVFVPELLPVSNQLMTIMFDKMVSDTRTFFGDKKMSTVETVEKMRSVRDSRDGDVIRMGASLGNQLMDLDVEERWRVLADFWAELMLYVAPSDDVETHVEKLASGGEFITHLWALLYHAGIREEARHPDAVGTAADSV